MERPMQALPKAALITMLATRKDGIGSQHGRLQIDLPPQGPSTISRVLASVIRPMTAGVGN